MVVGGGNTALDAVRELVHLGVEHVELVYRGREANMPGYAHEWKAAKVEGCTARWATQPVRFEGDGRVERAICVAYDDDKRPIPGSESAVECQLVLLAIGPNKIGDLVGTMPGIEVEWGVITVDEHHATGRPGVWAGGDCSNGAKEVVNAAAEGKTAAIAIDAYLTGGN